MNSTLLDVRGVSKSFNGTPRLKNVSFSIEKGDFLVIAGKNGSGKTLLMKHLNGLFPIRKGSLYYKGEDCYRKELIMKERVGIVFQNPDTQIVGLTVLDDLNFGPKNLGVNPETRKEIVNRTAEKLHITHLLDRNPHTLSGGELKRVTIGGVMAMSPDIIILDEPFIGLDYPGVIDVTKSLIKLKESGETVVIITHDLEKVMKYATRVILMDSGEVVFNGTPADSLTILEKHGIRRPVQREIGDMTWLK